MLINEVITVLGPEDRKDFYNQAWNDGFLFGILNSMLIISLILILLFYTLEV